MINIINKLINIIKNLFNKSEKYLSPKEKYDKKFQRLIDIAISNWEYKLELLEKKIVNDRAITDIHYIWSLIANDIERQCRYPYYRYEYDYKDNTDIFYIANFMRVIFNNPLLWTIWSSLYSIKTDFKYDKYYFSKYSDDNFLRVMSIEEQKRIDRETKEEELKKIEKQKEEDEIYLAKLNELNKIKPLDQDLKESLKVSQEILDISNRIISDTKLLYSLRKKYVK